MILLFFFILSFFPYQAKTSDFLIQNIGEFHKIIETIKQELRKESILSEKQDSELYGLILQALFLKPKPLSEYEQINTSSGQRERQYFSHITPEAILKLSETWLQTNNRNLDWKAILKNNEGMIRRLLTNIYSIDQAFSLEEPSTGKIAYQWLKNNPFETLRVLFSLHSSPCDESPKWKKELEQCKMFLLPSHQKPKQPYLSENLTTKSLDSLQSHPNQKEISKQIENFFKNLEELLQNLAQTSFPEKEMSFKVFLGNFEDLFQFIQFSQRHKHSSKKDLSLIEDILLAFLIPSESEPLSELKTIISFTKKRHHDPKEICLGKIDHILQKLLASKNNACDLHVLTFFREAIQTSDDPHHILEELTSRLTKHFGS